MSGSDRDRIASAPVSRRGPNRLWLALSLALAVSFGLSVMLGPTGLGLPDDRAAAWLVLSEIRFPRAALGAIAGGALGLAGASLQGYLRNPLAEPGLIGAGSGAALGAVLAIHTGLAGLSGLALPLGGLAGATATLAIVVFLVGEAAGTLTLILAGLAVSSLATALTSLALNLAPNPFASVEIVFWLMGSLADRSLTQLLLALPFVVGGGLLLMSQGRALDALSLGEDTAASLGVDVSRTRLIVVGGTALSVGAVTAFTGVIGFVGLMVPHLLRPLAGYRPSTLLPASLLGGATLVLLADVAVRLLSTVGDIRLGVFTALIGSPFFIWLVVTTRRELGP